MIVLDSLTKKCKIYKYLAFWVMDTSTAYLTVVVPILYLWVIAPFVTDDHSACNL